MWKRSALGRHNRCRLFHSSARRWQQPKDVIRIKGATFYRQHPSDNDTTESNPPLFSRLYFALPRSLGKDKKPEYWSVLSPSSLARTLFLQVVAGQHICIPPTARTYPSLSKNLISLQHGIKYVGFDAERGNSVGGNDMRGAYLSARYESRREQTDYSVLDYLAGHTELNALQTEQTAEQKQILEDVLDQLDLRSLSHMPVANLSNGQTRRARIGKALMAQPEVLLLDGPFMGLDPNSAVKIDSLLRQIAESQKPRIVMSLRPENGVPSWITHLVVTDDSFKVFERGNKQKVLAAETSNFAPAKLVSILRTVREGQEIRSQESISKDGWRPESPALQPGEALVEMRGVKVAYGDKVVLGNWSQHLDGQEESGLWWSLHRGQRCGIFGPNGSGKTTMLSLITSDHPQTYSLPIKLFGRSRLPGPGEAGISLFDIQRKMGHSSPEVHSFFPKQLTVRRALESAWADAPLARAKLTAEADRRIDAALRWFTRELNPKQIGETAVEKLEIAGRSRRVRAERRAEEVRQVYDDHMYDDSNLDWAEDVRFRELSFSSQRLVLFLRALIAQPDLVILDEALSGIDEQIRDKALLFLSHGEKIIKIEGGIAEPSQLAEMGKVTVEGLSPKQALLVISHSKEDVPGCLREWICLPEPGEGKLPRTGVLDGPLELSPKGWNTIWGTA